MKMVSEKAKQLVALKHCLSDSQQSKAKTYALSSDGRTGRPPVVI